MSVVNNRTLTGIISFDDGSGGVLSDGKLTSHQADIANGASIGGTSSIHKLDIADVLTLDGILNVNSVPISPTWLSYLQDCSSNIQDQIDSIIASAYALLSSNNVWTGTNEFEGDVTFSGGITGVPTLSANNTWTGTNDFTNTVTGLHAPGIANGTVSDLEFETLNGVTGNIQLQFESKQPQVNELFPISASAVGDVSYTSTDPVTNTEYSYLRGVTSSIQTQINAVTSSISGLLASVNTWTNANLYSTGWIELNGNASSLPTYSINGRGAIQGRSEVASSMCLINNNNNEDTGTSAFIFFKMFNSSLLTQIAWISNYGDFHCNGELTSASLTTTDIVTDDIITDTLTVNTSGVFPVGSKLRIQGSTAGTTAPTAGTGGYMYCRGQTTYGNSVSSMNAFSDTDADTVCFDWSKRTGTTTDLMRLYNAGDLWVKGYMQSKVLIQDIVEFSSDYTFTSWTFIPAIIMITANCNITMTEFNPTGLRCTVIRKTGNVTIKSARVGRNQIFVGGANVNTFLFNGGTTSIDLIFDSNGSWVVFN